MGSARSPRPPSAVGRRLWVACEAIAWVAGVVCLAYWGIRSVEGVIGRAEAMRQFAALETAAPPPAVPPDQRLWSPERIVAWKRALEVPGPAPLAVLRIPRLSIEVPVLEGTDETVLNRGVGHIEDTAAPGADGNSGIAGHRDGFFRGLKDIAAGDVVELQTHRLTETYIVQRTWIVDPEDVSVLDPTPGRAITLVTCHPFYFIGSAPQRFVVRAVWAGHDRALTSAPR